MNELHLQDKFLIPFFTDKVNGLGYKEVKADTISNNLIIEEDLKEFLKETSLNKDNYKKLLKKFKNEDELIQEFIKELQNRIKDSRNMALFFNSNKSITFQGLKFYLIYPSESETYKNELFEQNIFSVVQELPYKYEHEGEKIFSFRPDISIFLNGIFLSFNELKSNFSGQNAGKNGRNKIAKDYKEAVIKYLHIAKFNDVSQTIRKDFLKKDKCPDCGGELTQAKKFNLMMKTTLGIDQEAYLRPETATTTYLLYPEYFRFFRTKLPFGVFQIGKAYRNEISPRQGVFRTREFTQAEAQLFILKNQEKKYEKLKDYKNETLPLMKHNTKTVRRVKLGDIVGKKYMKKEAYAFMVYVAYKLVVDMGFDSKKIRIKQHSSEKLSHYADDAWDLEVKTDRYGWFELCGIHDRTDYDLKRHSEFSKTKMEVSGEIPRILEIAFGVERTTYSLLENSLVDDKKRDWLKFEKGMAPIDIGIFPLMKKDKLDKIAKEIFDELDKEFVCVYDESGSIGRRYRRMDEIGTSFCITVDHDSLKERDVTVRELATMKQTRVKISELKSVIRELLYGDLKFEKIK